MIKVFAIHNRSQCDSQYVKFANSETTMNYMYRHDAPARLGLGERLRRVGLTDRERERDLGPGLTDRERIGLRLLLDWKYRFCVSPDLKVG